MNKKQVGAFLKILSKDDARPILTAAIVDRYDGELYLVATDGYKLAAVKLDEDAQEIEGRLIRRDALERWYKLATGKSRLTSYELVDVSSDDYGRNNGYQEGNYPNWQSLIPNEDRPTGQYIGFNATFTNILQEVDGSEGLKWYIGLPLEAMMAKTDRGIYISMPLKV